MKPIHYRLSLLMSGRLMVLKLKQIACCKQSVVILGIFSCQYSTKSKALTRVCIVADSDGIGIRVVGYLVNAWHLVATNSIDNNVCRLSLMSRLILLWRFRPVDSTFHPIGLSIEILNNIFSKSDGSTTWSIKLMDMVCFLLYSHFLAFPHNYMPGILFYDALSHITYFTVLLPQLR